MLGKLLGLFTGGTGAVVGGAIANVATVAAAAAALAPAAYWFIHNKDGIALTLTWGQLAFVCLMLFGPLVLIIKIIHYTRSPGA